jgi:hypothetical protein
MAITVAIMFTLLKKNINEKPNITKEGWTPASVCQVPLNLLELNLGEIIVQQ